jgi:phage repressor protein C with HTH and peptisase S24 domain
MSVGTTGPAQRQDQMSRRKRYSDRMQGDRLRQLAEYAGFGSVANLARAAGVKVQAAQKQANRNSIPSKAAEAYIRAARATGADLNWLLTGSGTAPKRTSQVEKSTIDRRRSLTGILHAGEVVARGPTYSVNESSRLPIRETLEKDGYFILTERVIDTVVRPGYLSAETDAFSFYVKADDMEPRYERGDRLLANPSLPVVPGKDYLLLGEKAADGIQRGIVRRVLSFTDDHWRVRSYKLARTYNESRKEWPIAIRIEAGRYR